MSRIFISFRPNDSGAHSRRVFDYLSTIFGAADLAVPRSAPPGVDVRAVLAQQAASAQLVLAIIGPHWASAPQLQDPNDSVRICLDTAVRQNLPIIPVLVRGAILPNPEQLPPSLRSLAYRSALNLREDPDFEADAVRLVATLRQALPPVAASAPRAASAYTPAPQQPPYAQQPYTQQPDPRQFSNPPRAAERVVIERRNGSGFFGMAGRFIAQILSFIGSLFATIIRQMLASVVGFIMGFVIIAFVLVAVGLFIVSMAQNNLEIGRAISSMGEIAIEIWRSLSPQFPAG